MSYKNEHLLTIANKYGKASGAANAELFETYDKLRDLTVSGSSIMGDGFGPFTTFLMNAARLIAPSGFMPVLGNQSMNIPGTSYSSPISGGNSVISGATSAFGYGQLGNYPGFPSGGAAPIANSLQSLGAIFGSGIGSISGSPTGGAASMVQNATSAAGLATGTANGFGKGSILLPMAGIISGIGGIATTLGPYFGPIGTFAGIAGYMASGYGGAILNAYQYTTGKIVSNADVILSNKIRNIETVVKQLNTQSDIVRKMLKGSIEGDQKAIQNL